MSRTKNVVPKSELLVMAVQSAGPAGISQRELCAAISVGNAGLRKHLDLARKAGHTVHCMKRWSSTEAGGRYFAHVAWIEAARVEWAKAKREVYRARKDRQNAVDRAKTAAKRAAMPPKPAKTPKLHALGAVIPSALGRDGKPVPAHNQLAMRSLRPTINALPVDYSKARVIVCPSSQDTRYTAKGPVPRVTDSSECRPWALAAVGERA